MKGCGDQKIIKNVIELIVTIRKIKACFSWSAHCNLPVWNNNGNLLSWQTIRWMKGTTFSELIAKPRLEVFALWI